MSRADVLAHTGACRNYLVGRCGRVGSGGAPEVRRIRGTAGKSGSAHRFSSEVRASRRRDPRVSLWDFSSTLRLCRGVSCSLGRRKSDDWFISHFSLVRSENLSRCQDEARGTRVPPSQAPSFWSCPNSTFLVSKMQTQKGSAACRLSSVSHSLTWIRSNVTRAIRYVISV